MTSLNRYHRFPYLSGSADSSSGSVLNAIEYIITTGYFDEIKKQRIKEHSNEVGGSNLVVYPVVTRKLRHATTTERELVNPYKKPNDL